MSRHVLLNLLVAEITMLDESALALNLPFNWPIENVPRHFEFHLCTMYILHTLNDTIVQLKKYAWFLLSGLLSAHRLNMGNIH